MNNITTDCDCCEGIDVETPKTVVNRPGLLALAYRVGTHGAFLESMKARLSTMQVPTLDSDLSSPLVTTPLTSFRSTSLPESSTNSNDLGGPLRELKTRDADDPAIALLDGWATVADVLTFYQERIANEGFLRTATERRSVLELARLVGYALRPGVAATTYLAYMIDDKFPDTAVIPIGAKVQSVPGPGETAQIYETVEKIEARAKWNQLKLRTSQPMRLIEKYGDSKIFTNINVIFVQAATSNLKPGDALLFVLMTDEKPSLTQFKHVEKVETLVDNKGKPLNKIKVTLQRIDFVKSITEGLRNTLDIDTLKDIEDPDCLINLIDSVSIHLKIILNEAGTYEKVEPVPSETALKELYDFIDDVKDRLIGFLIKFQPPTELKTFIRLKEYKELKQKFDELRKSIFKLLAIFSQIRAKLVNSAADSRNFILDLGKLASVPPRNALYITRSFEAAFRRNSDVNFQIFKSFLPNKRDQLSDAFTNSENGQTQSDQAVKVEIYAFRAKAALFGHNAPLRAVVVKNRTTTRVNYDEWDINKPDGASNEVKLHNENTLYLDAEYSLPVNSWVATEKADRSYQIYQVGTDKNIASSVSVAGYGFSGKSTRLSSLSEIQNSLTGKSSTESPTFKDVRETTVYVQSETLKLAEMPICENVDQRTDNVSLELDGFYDGLSVGRWAIVTGERTDVPGMKDTELVMLSEVSHPIDETLPGDTRHTKILFATPLQYTYKRDTVMIYGNVVKATHGETRQEVLGSGNGSQAMQTFSLRQPPLTFVSSPTPSGVESTLQVFVNDVAWKEEALLSGLGRRDQAFITRTDDAGNTTVVFGNGWQGARLPTGQNNVKAIYRNGIGDAGNVKAGQISSLMTRPLGVKEVINPKPATGGADRETRDQARRNTPLAVMALDRLVSLQDYQDFARVFAGIGKASAVRLALNGASCVHLTIAGARDIPIDRTSDLFIHLAEELRKHGDMLLPVRIDVREILMLVISATVQIKPNYLWEPVAVKIRASLNDVFGFENRELGQDALPSEAITAIQSIEGVQYVDVDVFGAIPEKMYDSGLKERRLMTPKELGDAVTELLNADSPKQPKTRVHAQLAHPDTEHPKYEELVPASLACILPNIPDTVIINRK